MKNLLTILFLLCVITSKAQVLPEQAVIIIKREMSPKRGLTRTLTDTVLVRNNYILEQIKEYYSTDETTLSTSSTESFTREISSGTKLKSYCFSNLKEMIGMNFDAEKIPSAKAIQPYQFSLENPKKGITFINEPFLAGNLTTADYVKEKDTIISGEKCFLVKRTKVIPIIYKGREYGKIVQFRLAINPKLTSYAFPFVSEKIVQHFGGGAIVYMEGRTDRGYKSATHYSYSDFKPADKILFNRYQELYESNIALLDKFKKK